MLLLTRKRFMTFFSVCIILTLVFSSVYILLKKEKKEKIVVFHAGSLTYPIDQLVAVFTEIYSDTEIQSEAAGSVASIRKITDQYSPADVLLVSDYKLIDTLMIENEEQWANWSIVFAKNSIVVAFTEKSKFAFEINSSNWYTIVNRSSVITTRSNPADDPCGYRTLITINLASIYYNDSDLWFNLLNHPTLQEPWSSNEAQLVAPLELGEIDYAFLYESMALQYNLSYINLPDEINLGEHSNNEFYRNATIFYNGITGGLAEGPGNNIVSKKGNAIWYGLTIPNNSPNYELALRFVQFVLSVEGLNLIESKSFQPTVNPPQTKDIMILPESLRKYVVSNIDL